MKKRRFWIIPVVGLLVAGAPLFAQESTLTPSQLLNEGVSRFQQGAFEQGLVRFREALLNAEETSVEADAYFWIAKSAMALNRLEEAEQNLEYYLMNYPDNRYYSEANYQRGRLLFLQEDYQSAIQAFQQFLEEYRDSPFVANAYYWTGESLYELGRLDEAQRIFTTVVREFPTSFRVEAARYRLSLIELKGREEELLRLLRRSHESFLAAQEEFQRRQTGYEEALDEYQERLAAGATEGARAEISRLTSRVRELEEELTSREARVRTLEQEVTRMREQMQESSENANGGQ
ncbi:MAG: tetratricopeptide repeat protein [Alkalispirochaetaceae bacterium]